MQKLTPKDLLEAGVHFGHLKKKRNPKMSPYIFKETKGIHLIDLNISLEKLNEAALALKSVAQSGKKILFVATKKQAKKIIEEGAQKVNMPFVTERWLGGMLTNFATIRKSIKKMQSIETLLNDRSSLDSINKKERLVLGREKQKMEKVFGGIAQLNRMPAAVFIVDINKEHIVLAEANKLNISTYAMVDTNSDPTLVDFPIPSNDDANKSIAIITNYIVDAIQEGLELRQKNKDEQEKAVKDNGDKKTESKTEVSGKKDGSSPVRPDKPKGKKMIHRKPKIDKDSHVKISGKEIKTPVKQKEPRAEKASPKQESKDIPNTGDEPKKAKS